MRSATPPNARCWAVTPPGRAPPSTARSSSMSAAAAPARPSSSCASGWTPRSERRLTALLAKPATRASAATLLAETGWLGLDAARQRALQARVGPATRAATGTAKANATAANVEILTVSRADYARFANATGRAAAECGKGFFGRKLKWNNTGSDRKPVACVSAADAQAYASWLGVQDGVRYHLPSAGELRAQPTKASGWLALCADHACNNRMANGEEKPLDASRGYSDVGILLARTR